MIRFSSAFWQVAAITVLVLHGSAWASESPLAVTRATVEQNREVGQPSVAAPEPPSMQAPVRIAQ